MSGAFPAGPLLRTLRGENVRPRPLWLMRQAGRYLPEYRALRLAKGGFLAMVYDADAAAEITLQPLRRYAFDGAILFSDILIVPYAMGQHLEFVAGEGPKLSPRLAEAALAGLIPVHERLAPIYETVRKVRAGLSPEQTMLGFAGSPWTVATYMVAGEGSRDQHDTRAYAYRDPPAFQAIIDGIEAVTIEYLAGQIEAGAEAVQLFDSWAGTLAPREFERWVIAPNAAIVTALKARYPDVPVIGFPKGAGEKLAAYAQGTGVDAIGLDETIDPVWAAKVLPPDLPVQGNLDPLLLLAGGAELEARAIEVLETFADRPHVFNLGHGIGQTTPLEHVARLVEGGARLARLIELPAMQQVLSMTYLWLKAGHIIFVIFWMAGLFMLPRFFVYHQEAPAGSPEAALWVEREGKLFKIILWPSLVMVWLLGMLLAVSSGAFAQGWFHAKLGLVLVLTAYHFWLASYGMSLARGERKLSGKTLRLLNEVPGVTVALIVILVVVKPF